MIWPFEELGPLADAGEDLVVMRLLDAKRIIL